MNIAPNTVATIHYTLTDGHGNLIESSQGGEPLDYIHGIGAIVPGLEAALDGKAAGDTFRVTLPPEAAYGERDEALVQVLPRQLFSEPDELEVGMRFRAQSEAGPLILTVIDLDGQTVTVDGNHPLAGVTLNFDVAVVNVRAATREELEHGHAHGPAGH